MRESGETIPFQEARTLHTVSREKDCYFCREFRQGCSLQEGGKQMGPRFVRTWPE